MRKGAKKIKDFRPEESDSSESFFLRERAALAAASPAGPPCASRPRAAEAPRRGSGGRQPRALRAPDRGCPPGGGGGGCMEPATAPQPAMPPELTPEEEQVSGPAAARWVCPDPRGLGGVCRRPALLAPPGRRGPLPAATAPQAVVP